MKTATNLKVLDCTLRDGGYVNNFDFGQNAITSILSSLYYSGADFIECGFMEDNAYDSNKTLFPDLDAVNRILPNDAIRSKTFAMIKCGRFDVKKLPPYSEKYIKGFRVIFKKNQIVSAFDSVEVLKNKGYDVCINLTFIENYSNAEIVQLIDEVNKISPYAFYFVDSTGSMTQNRVKEVFKLVDSTLNQDIIIGFHSHNNMQLSFHNVLEFIQCCKEKECARMEECSHKEECSEEKKCAQNQNTKNIYGVYEDNMQGRKIMVDTCTYGIGRGAGNLPSELLLDYLNKSYDKNYNTDFLLKIINDYLVDIRKKTPWGYSIEYFLSALYKCHPSYATHFKMMGNLSINDMNKLFKNMPPSLKNSFNREFTEKYVKNNCAANCLF